MKIDGARGTPQYLHFVSWVDFLDHIFAMSSFLHQANQLIGSLSLSHSLTLPLSLSLILTHTRTFFSFRSFLSHISLLFIVFPYYTHFFFSFTPSCLHVLAFHFFFLLRTQVRLSARAQPHSLQTQVSGRPNLKKRWGSSVVPVHLVSFHRTFVLSCRLFMTSSFCLCWARVRPNLSFSRLPSRRRV